MFKDFFLGFVRVHILHHACEEPIYGAGIGEELARHGYRLSAGTLYPMLHTLEKKGYLTSYEETVGGKVRRYYRATSAGEEALVEARSRISELVKEVIQESPAETPEGGT